MSYQILGFSTSPFTQNRIYSLLCDTAADLPASVDGYSVGQGWTAKVIEDGSSYIANAAGSWIQQPSSVFTSNYYTKAETDGRLSAHVCQCDTAGNVADKVATTSDDFVLREGAIIAVKYKYTNTQTDTSSHPITLNVNDTGAFRVYMNNGQYTNTSSGNFFGYADFWVYYTFSGSRWIWTNTTRFMAYETMSQGEATAGTSTANRVITPKVLHDTITEIAYAHDSVQVDLNVINWTLSGSGLYFSDLITTMTALSKIYALSLSGFSNLRATDVITPACNRTGGWQGFRLYANTNSFNVDAWVTVSGVGEKA